MPCDDCEKLKERVIHELDDFKKIHGVFSGLMDLEKLCASPKPVDPLKLLNRAFNGEDSAEFWDEVGRCLDTNGTETVKKPEGFGE